MAMAKLDAEPVEESKDSDDDGVVLEFEDIF